MARSSGQKPGQTPPQPPPLGFTWADYLGAVIAVEGTLTAVAWKLVSTGGPEDVASIERALRRLRERGQRDGGAWGQRLVRAFPVPRAVEERLRWMGLYHSPFSDLPLELCIDQLRLWDRPPLSESRARVWLQLGHASTALRQRAFDEAGAALARAAAVVSPPDAARIELLLARAYLESRTGTAAGVQRQLDLAEEELKAAPADALGAEDRACFVARLVDQRAFQHNRVGEHAAALALYRSLPANDTHPFASYRRDAGLAYGCLRTGQRDEALRYARRACDHAGDGGYTRLRVMALILSARVEAASTQSGIHPRTGTAAATLQRAEAIAARLGDTELLSRVARVRLGRGE
jgi:tetratricopeptide (TPR) repeat protein